MLINVKYKETSQVQQQQKTLTKKSTVFNKKKTNFDLASNFFIIISKRKYNKIAFLLLTLEKMLTLSILTKRLGDFSPGLSTPIHKGFVKIRREIRFVLAPK